MVTRHHLARRANHGCRQCCRRTYLGTVSADFLEQLRSTMDTELRNAGSGKGTVTAYIFAVKGFRFAESHSVNLCGTSRGAVQYLGELQSPTRRANANMVRIDQAAICRTPRCGGVLPQSAYCSSFWSNGWCDSSAVKKIDSL